VTRTQPAAAADLEEWVRSNADTFDSVARASGAARDLVHLAAVFVKSGLTDEQILTECQAVTPRFGARQRVEAALRRALLLLRSALASDPAGDDR
jgi:hypothetical protein